MSASMLEQCRAAVPAIDPIVMAQNICLNGTEQLAWIDFRGDLRSADVRRRFERATHCRADIPPNRFVQVGDRMVIALGPDELLILTPSDEREKLISALEHAVRGVHAAVTDVTGNRVRWRLSGDYAREFLAAGCSIDFHSRVFEPGMCAQTLFARVPVTILQISAEPLFELHVRRSFDQYLRKWARRASACFTGGALS